MTRWTVRFTADGRRNQTHRVDEADARAFAERVTTRGWIIHSVEPMRDADLRALVADMLTPRPNAP